MTKILGFIPCRSGSKRITNKNLTNFNSKTLIQNTYDLADSSNCIDRIVISTDSNDYLQKTDTTSKYLDIGLRSSVNSSDESTDQEVLFEVIEKLETISKYFDYIVHLRPTYPSLLPNCIDHAVNTFLNCSEATSLKSVEKLDLYYQKCLVESDSDSNRIIGLDGDSQNKTSSTPSASCKHLYAQTAALDIYKVSTIKQGLLWGDYCLKYEMGEYKADIDNYFDFPFAYSSLDQLISSVRANNKIPSVICLDIDGVIFSRSESNDYSKVQPNPGVINLIQLLYKQGHKIILFTARGSKTGINWSDQTISQLTSNSIPYHDLIFGKPPYDFYVDDRSISLQQLYNLFIAK